MHNRHTQAFHPTAGNEGGILNIGPVAISISNAGLRALVAAVEEIEAVRREAGDKSPSFLVADTALLDGTDWGSVAYVPERDSYNVRYRGVCWEASKAVVLSAADDVKTYLRECVEQEKAIRDNEPIHS